jgi:hypothetical protein
VPLQPCFAGLRSQNLQVVVVYLFSSSVLIVNVCRSNKDSDKKLRKRKIKLCRADFAFDYPAFRDKADRPVNLKTSPLFYFFCIHFEVSGRSLPEKQLAELTKRYHGK